MWRWSERLERWLSIVVECKLKSKGRFEDADALGWSNEVEEFIAYLALARTEMVIYKIPK